jgi:hypothetical protein
MEKVFVVKRVAEKLWAAEGAIDETIEQASALMSGIVEARRDLSVSHIVVDPAISKVAESMAALAQARRAMIEAHHALNEAKLRVGVRTKLDGPHPSVDADHEPLATVRRAS